MTTAISVKGLSKRYKIGAAQTKFRYGMLRDVMVDSLTAPIRFAKSLSGKSGNGSSPKDNNFIWALKDVSFDLEEGRVLGIVGRNGAGKSTLLKILSRVTEPTEGTVAVRGRVGSLLEVGTGFHPEAAHLEPEILVVDEVLAVGDAEFQRKCLGKMNDVAQQGRTVLFVSHNMSAILRLTQEAIVLKKGQLIKRAPTPEAVDFYLASGQAESGERSWEPDEIPAASAPFTPICLRLKDRTGKIVDTVRSTEPVTVEWEYQLDAPVTGLRVGMYLGTMRGGYVFTAFDTDDAKQYEQFGARQAGRYISRCHIPADFFNEGRYSLGVNASSFGVRRYFMDENALSFNVDISGAPGTQWPEIRQGPVRPRLDWQIEKLD